MAMGPWNDASSSLSTECWLAGVAALFVAAGSGFVAGLYCARLRERAAYDQARSGISQLVRTLLATLDTARELCAKLEQYPGKFLQPAQQAQIEERRGGLLDILSRIIGRHAPPPEPPLPAEPEPPPNAPIRMNWLMNPVDPLTELPDRPAFEANLSALLAATRAANRDSSLMLIRVDKLQGLAARFGQTAAARLLKRLSGVVCRAVRDSDLVCRCNPDTLAVLFPGLDLEAASRLGRAVRDSVRSHHFQIDETGAEVLLTASFGCTACRPDENPELVLNRGFDALSKSQRLGRNQLHIHDGESLVHCATS